MKTKTRITDLEKLIRRDLAADALKTARRTVDAALDLRQFDRVRESLPQLEDAHRAHDDADAAFRKLPPARRTLAAQTHGTALDLAHGVTRYHGGSYSGNTSTRCTIDTEASNSDAWTNISHGDQYSRSCTYRKNDATHHVNLTPADAVALATHSGIVSASRRDGLPLIHLGEPVKSYPDTRPARWVQTGKGGKALDTRSGWVAYDEAHSIIYHSTADAKHAHDGLARKVSQHLETLRQRRLNAKETRRAALVARLCHNVKATLADAKALHYCDPGIRQFQTRYGIGDEATLPELVRTGDPSAVRLAMTIARKVRRDTRNGAAA